MGKGTSPSTLCSVYTQYMYFLFVWRFSCIFLGFFTEPAMGNFSDEVVQQPSSEDVLAQSDASEGFPGNRIATAVAEETPSMLWQNS